MSGRIVVFIGVGPVRLSVTDKVIVTVGASLSVKRDGVDGAVPGRGGRWWVDAHFVGSVFGPLRVLVVVILSGPVLTVVGWVAESRGTRCFWRVILLVDCGD